MTLTYEVVRVLGHLTGYCNFNGCSSMFTLRDKVKSCYKPLRLGTVIVLVSSGKFSTFV